MSTNEYPTNQAPEKKSGVGGCLKAAGIGCGVILIVVIGLSIWGVNIMMKNPATRNVFQQSQAIGKCGGNLASVGQALTKYAADHGGKYPTKLDDLYPTYISDKSKLTCPQAEPGSSVSCYEYSRPAPTAPDTTVVVTCRQHVVVNGQPPIPVQLMKNGKIQTDSRGVQSPNHKPMTPPTPVPAPTKH